MGTETTTRRYQRWRSGVDQREDGDASGDPLRYLMEKKFTRCRLWERGGSQVRLCRREGRRERPRHVLLVWQYRNALQRRTVWQYRTV